MSEITPEDDTSKKVIEDDASKKSEKNDVDTKTKEDEVPEKEKSDEKKQQEARAIRAEKELKEARAKLDKFEEAEEDKRKAELEKKGQYDTLMAELSEAKESNATKISTQAEEIATLTEKLQKVEDDAIAVSIAKLPEDKRELVSDIIGGYQGEEKITKLNSLVEAFGGLQSFGGVPGGKKPAKVDEFDELRKKVLDGSITSSEMNRYKELKKNNT